MKKPTEKEFGVIVDTRLYIMVLIGTYISGIAVIQTEG